MRSFFLGLLLLAAVSCGGMAGANREFDQGLAFYNQGNYAQAAEHFRKATELSPEYAEAYMYLGRSHLNQGRYGDALGPLRTAYRLDPAGFRKNATDIFLDAIFGSAMDELSRGNLGGALGNLREGLGFSPEAKAQVLPRMLAMGRDSLALGRWGDAAALFKEYVGAQADLTGKAEGYLGLARAFMGNGEWMKALEAAGNASRLNPGLGSPQQLLGK